MCWFDFVIKEILLTFFGNLLVIKHFIDHRKKKKKIEAYYFFTHRDLCADFSLYILFLYSTSHLLHIQLLHVLQYDTLVL